MFTGPILTFVMITISSRGRLRALMAFPKMVSEIPFEYIWN